MDVFSLVGTLTLAGADKVNQQLSETERQAQKVQKGLRIAGAALTALGAAGLKFVDTARKTNAQLAVTALNLDITTEEMRNLTLETANVTFAIDEVVKTFDLLARAGVESTEILQIVATAFDTLGDAIGIPASLVTQMMVPAMKTFNLSAEEMAKKTDMFTFMSRKSTMSLGDFNTMVGYTTPQLVAQGLTIEDLTASLILMERQGYAPGRVMTREFMKATTLAQKEVIPLTEALGFETEEVQALKDEMADATGITQEYADAANAQYGIMDKLKFLWSKLTLQVGSFLTPLEPVLAVMVALGPVMLFLSTSMGKSALMFLLHGLAVIKSHLATVAHTISSRALAGSQTLVAGATVAATGAQWGLNRAMMANPIIAIIAGITALVIALIYLWRNWESVSMKMERAWLSFKKFVGAGVDTTQVRLDALEIEQAWIDLVKKVKEELATMLFEVESYTTQAIQAFENEANEAIANAERVAGAEKEILQGRADFYRDKHYERLELINEEMLAEIKAIDPVLAAEIEAAQEGIKALENRAEERQRIRDEDRLAGLKEQLDKDDLSRREKRRIEGEIQAMEDAGKEEAIREEIYQKISEAKLEDHYDNRITMREEHLAREISYWEDTWLPAQIKVHQEDLKNLREYHKDAENLTAEHVAEVLEIYRRAVPEEERMEFVIPKGPVPEKRWKPELWELLTLGLAGAAMKEMMGYKHGGEIPEPTLLYGLRSKRAYAVAGEAGVEYVSRERGGRGGDTFVYNVSFPGVIIREEQDLHKLSALVSQELRMLTERTERRIGLRGG